MLILYICINYDSRRTSIDFWVKMSKFKLKVILDFELFTVQSPFGIHTCIGYDSWRAVYLNDVRLRFSFLDGHSSFALYETESKA